METVQNTILDQDFSTQSATVRRRSLLPWWIKVFVWLFMIAGVLTPLVMIAGAFGVQPQLALYGIQTTDVMTLVGAALCAMYLLKGAAAYGLWFETDWAINVGRIDAVVGILVCAFMMIGYPAMMGTPGMTFRLEILLLIPYLVKLNRIKSAWDSARPAVN